MLQEYRQWQRRVRLSPRKYLTQKVSDATLKPFHDAILPEELRKASAFERSFSTRLGATLNLSYCPIRSRALRSILRQMPRKPIACFIASSVSSAIWRTFCVPV